MKRTLLDTYIQNSGTRIFLGGHCGNSIWRDQVAEHLRPDVNVFNPQVPAGTWTEKDHEIEILARKVSDYHVYGIQPNPETNGVLTMVEFTHDSMLNPGRTILAFFEGLEGHTLNIHEEKAWKATQRMLEQYSITVIHGPEALAEYLNKL